MSSQPEREKRADQEATEERGENARLSSFVGAMALGDLVKSTLGPKGMNKILRTSLHITLWRYLAPMHPDPETLV